MAWLPCSAQKNRKKLSKALASGIRRVYSISMVRKETTQATETGKGETMRLYHGTHNNLMGTGTAHEGMCWTEDQDSAEAYASGGTVYELEMSDLNIVECDGYDRDENAAPADDDGFRAEMAASGADVLVYTDEDERGREHECYRLVSGKAVAMAAENMREV